MSDQRERWERAGELFEGARALPEPQRTAWLQAAGADPDLIAEVLELLRAHESLALSADGFLHHIDVRRTLALLESTAEGNTDDLSEGAVLGRYRIVRRIAHGGMGVVYLADDVRLGRRAALKLLPAHLSVDDTARRRFDAEARAASALDHPNVVTVYDVGEAPDGRVFIAMSYCEGPTLRELLDSGPLSVPQAVSLATQIAEGLAAAHARGIVHRDIKPRNIVVTGGGVAKIVDFGIARMAGGAQTQTALTPGTVAYMSPEQTRGAVVDARADVWALGVLLFEMLAGKRPFHADQEEALVFAIRNDEPAHLGALRPEVPAQLTRIVERCLCKDAADRFEDATAVLAALRGRPVEASGMSAIAPQRQTPRAAWVMVNRRGARIRAGGAAALLVLGAAAALGVRATTAQQRLDERRVAVAMFENRTGTPEFDELGSMAADWIVHGLWQTGAIEVVPLNSGPGHTDSETPIVRARRVGARLLVAGALYRDGETLRAQARITDLANGRIVAVLDPVAAPLAAPLTAIEELRQHTQAALFARLDTQMTHVRAVQRPPLFEAYSAYLAGRDAHAERNLPEALRHFQRAAELDSAFILPHVISAIVLNQMGNVSAADSILLRLERVPDRLDRFSEAHVTWLRGTLRGDRHASYRGMRDAARLAPGNTLIRYQLADEAVRLGRADHALDVLSTMQPETGELRGWIGYWGVLSAAHHLRASHRRELAEARRARQHYIDDPRQTLLETRALAALGRVDQLEQLLAAAVARPAHGEPNPGALLLSTALELRAHATPRQSARFAAADRMLTRAIAWYAANLPERQTVRHRFEHATALAAAGRRAEARRALQQLIEAPPAPPPGPSPLAPRTTPSYPDSVSFHGTLGVLAALDGDTSAAAYAVAWLDAVRDPYARGRPTYWRGAILAAQGQHERAVAVLRQAFDEGVPWSLAWHTAPELETLRGHAGFSAFLRVER